MLPKEVSTGTEGRTLEAGTDTEAITQCFSLASCSRLSQITVLYLELLGGSLIHSGLGPPITTINLETPPRLALGHSNWGVFSTQALSSQVTLSYIKITRS